jgi:hypothetical protein
MTPTDTPPKTGRGGKRPGAGRPRKVTTACPHCRALIAAVAELHAIAKAAR